MAHPKSVMETLGAFLSGAVGNDDEAVPMEAGAKRRRRPARKSCRCPPQLCPHKRRGRRAGRWHADGDEDESAAAAPMEAGAKRRRGRRGGRRRCIAWNADGDEEEVAAVPMEAKGKSMQQIAKTASTKGVKTLLSRAKAHADKLQKQLDGLNKRLIELARYKRAPTPEEARQFVKIGDDLKKERRLIWDLKDELQKRAERGASSSSSSSGAAHRAGTRRKLDAVQTARQLVWQGAWKRTPGGLTKSDLKMTADGRIVSKRASAAAKRRYNANPSIRRAFAQARK